MTDAAPDAGDDQLAAAPHISASPGQAVLSGFRQPAVAVLLLIALCTAITGKPLDGVLMVTIAMLLVVDVARSSLRGPGNQAAPVNRASTAIPANPATRLSPAEQATGTHGPQARRASRQRMLAGLAGLAGLATAGLYAAFVGSFSRYSWPATIAVVAVGCLVVAIGWQGPLRQRPALTGRPQRRSWLWAVIVVVGGLWELSSLLQQPHLTTDSYAHPTISALTDPLLAGHPGRSVVLALWLLTGWYVVDR